jgi:hypothetical protein
MRLPSGCIIVAAAALSAGAAAPATAQPDPTSDRSPVHTLHHAGTATSASADVGVQSTSPSLKARVGRMVTGAVVGGWLGYFASQIAVSDWEQGPGAGIQTNRGAWAASGVIVGAVAGRFLSPGQRLPGDVPDMTRGRSLLTYDDIVRSGAGNAYDLIRASRAEWLVPRGVNSWRETAQGSAGFGQQTVIVPGDDLILVYLDNARIGGTQHLDGITLGNVAQIEFIEPAAATFRWGGGHAHGVILISTLTAQNR